MDEKALNKLKTHVCSSFHPKQQFISASQHALSKISHFTELSRTRYCAPTRTCGRELCLSHSPPEKKIRRKSSGLLFSHAPEPPELDLLRVIPGGA